MIRAERKGGETNSDTGNLSDVIKPSGQSMSSTCGLPCPIIRAEKKDGEINSDTGKEEKQLSDVIQLSEVESMLLWLQIKLNELIPGYMDGVTQKISRRTGGLPKGQSREEETDRRSSGEGATESALTCESGGVFQNHALKYGHNPACTWKIRKRRRKFRTRVSRLAGRGGLRRLARQGGSSNPKGGAGQEEERIKTSQWPQTKVGSRYIRKKV
jgi:hypothetical protein